MAARARQSSVAYWVSARSRARALVAELQAVQAGARAARRGRLAAGSSGSPAPPTDSAPSVPSPEVHGVVSSTADFVPGAARVRPLAAASRGGTPSRPAPNLTRGRHGQYAQLWSVAPDGVTLTATSEPIVATPELLARAHADLGRARPIWASRRRAHDPHMGTVTLPPESGAVKEAVAKAAAAQDAADAPGASALAALLGDR